MIYLFLFKHAKRSRIALWAWRKWAGLLTLAKHLRRRNWRQAGVWLLFVLAGTKGVK